MPASLETLALYCQFLSRSMIPASVRNYLSGVKLLHLLAGEDITVFKSYELTILLRGLDRLAQHVPNRAPPVTPDNLLQLVSLVDFTNPVEVTFMSAFLCTFFLLARVSNIVPSTVSSFQPSMHLCRRDIVPTSTGLVVLFKHTFGKRRLLLPLLRMPQSPLCPVQMYELMCSLVPAPPLSLPPFYSPQRPVTPFLLQNRNLFPFFGTFFVRQVFRIIARFGVTHFDGGPLLGLFV